MDAIELSQRLRYWRENAGLSPVQLARKIGTHQSSISHWDARRCFPGSLKLMEIARACGVSMRQFWGPMARRSRKASAGT